jgi:hypothetical protein
MHSPALPSPTHTGPHELLPGLIGNLGFMSGFGRELRRDYEGLEPKAREWGLRRDHIRPSTTYTATLYIHLTYIDTQQPKAGQGYRERYNLLHLIACMFLKAC